MRRPAHRPHPVRDLRAAASLFFAHESPRLLGLQVVIAVLGRLWLAAPPDRLEWILLAAIALYWPIQEYALHRWVLHARPTSVAGFTIDTIAARYHRRHHEEPWSLHFTFLPPPMVGLLIPIHVLLWRSLTPSWETALTGIAAFGGAALMYEWVHFLTHTAYRPRTRWMRDVTRRHRWHHFKHEQLWFAFVVPAVDGAFGTDADPATVTRSDGCLDLLHDEDEP